jgi:hypothetical protein
MKYSSISYVFLMTALALAAPLSGQQRTGQVLRHGTMTPEETQTLVELSNSSTDNPDAPPPLWTHSAVAPRDGHVYTSVSIGSSPYADLKATKIPVVVVPLVVTVGGVTLDPTAVVTNSCVRPDWNGKTPLQMLLQSPIFTATTWTMNGVNIGSAQYLDAFQRAQYWSLVQGSRYHTELNPVTVADAQIVPASAIDPTASTAASACVAQAGGNPDQIILGRSDTGLLTQWIETTLIPSLQSQNVIDSRQLVYFLLYNTTFSDATGFHSYVGNQTYATSLINGSDCCTPDIAAASHVLGEWMNDPIPTETQNSPGWTAPADKAGNSDCQKYSAVGVPSADLLLPAVLMPNGVAYHPQELTFQSWFQGAASTGAGGLYSNNASLAVDAGAVCHVVVGSGPLTITTTALNIGVAGQAYSQTLTATGGALPYTWSLVGGRLPPGLTLSPAGVISGTPTALAGGSLVRIQVVDSSNPEETATASLEVPYFLGITTESLSNGLVGQAYFQGLTATGGTTPYAWQLTAGTLPPGLTFNSTTGAIGGTPSLTVAAAPLTFTVTDSSSPPASTSATFTLTITATPLSVTTTALANGVVGASYSQTLAATGGTSPYTWQLTAGTLPPGLTLNSGTGAIGGIPTSAVTATPLTFGVTDSSALAQTLPVSLTLTIIPQLTAPPLSLNCVAGGPCSTTLAATGGVTPYSWQLPSGILPPGLTLNSATGAISGTPTSALTATPFIFKVTDSGTPQQSATTTVMISIAPLQITTVALPNGIVGTPYSQGIATTGGTSPFTWQLTSGTLPAGLTLNTSTGVISGVPTAPVTATPLTFKVTDSGTPQQTATTGFLTLTILPLLVTAPAVTLNCVVSNPCSATLTVTGGVPLYTWQLTAGTLPTGLTLNASTGQISGTPAAAMGATGFVFKVTDSGTPQQGGTTTVTITIANLQITTVALPNGVVNTAYSQALVATGGTTPYTWQLTLGTLPAGLTLNPSTGVIGGVPTSPVTATPLTFKVTDSSTPQQTATKALTLTILPLLVTAPAVTLNCVVSNPCSTTLTVTGGVSPYSWQLTAGTLPAGLTLNASTGQISGTPAAAMLATGFVFKVTDSGTPQQSGTTTVTIMIANLQITTVALPNGVVNTAYSQAVVATGGTTPYTWQLTFGTLPAGLTLNPSTGVISGVPTSPVTATPLTFKVTDSGTPQQTTTANLTLTILPQLIPGPAVTLNCLLNTPCSATLTVTGGVSPYSWQLTAGTLPTGLTLNSSTWQISGTPTVPTPATAFTFKVTDSGNPQQSGTTTVTITVANPVLQITTTSLVAGVTGTPYSQTLTATGGTAPYTWSRISGRLPAGITLNPSTGLISGTTSTATSVLVTFQVTDSSSPQQTATVQFTLTINSTP